MKWMNVVKKEVSKLVKEKLNDDDVYNVTMNKVKKMQMPPWAELLMNKVDDIAGDVKTMKNDVVEIKKDIVFIKDELVRLEVKIDNNTSLIRRAHPEFF